LAYLIFAARDAPVDFALPLLLCAVTLLPQIVLSQSAFLTPVFALELSLKTSPIFVQMETCAPSQITAMAMECALDLLFSVQHLQTFVHSQSVMLQLELALKSQKEELFIVTQTTTTALNLISARREFVLQVTE